MLSLAILSLGGTDSTIPSTGRHRLGIVEDPSQGPRDPGLLLTLSLALRLELFKLVDLGPGGAEEHVKLLLADYKTPLRISTRISPCQILQV